MAKDLLPNLPFVQNNQQGRDLLPNLPLAASIQPSAATEQPSIIRDIGQLGTALIRPAGLQQVGTGLVQGLGGLLGTGLRTDPFVPPQISSSIARFIQRQTTPTQVAPGIVPTIERGFGRFLPFAVAAEAAPEIIGARGILPAAGRIGISAAAGAAQAPQHQIAGAAIGALAGAGIEGLQGIGSLIRQAPNLFLGPLAKNVATVAERQNQIGKDLYARAFQGTENVVPTLSGNTEQSLSDLQELYPGKQSVVNKAIRAFRRTPSIERVHGLRSDLSKEFRRLGDKAAKSGLTTSETDNQAALDTVTTNLTQDTRANLVPLGPEKVAQYDAAQTHWRNNVMPFRNVDAVRKLLTGKREVKPALFGALAQKTLPEEGQVSDPEQIRKLLGTPEGLLKTGELLHRRYFGVPIGVWMAAGVGPAALFARHIL